MKIKYSLLVLFSCGVLVGQTFTKTDSIFGGITPERVWWDLQHYELSVEVFPETRSISGTNLISYRVLDEKNLLQLDLQAPMRIDSVFQNGKKLKITSEGMFHYVKLQKKQRKGKEYRLKVHFSGNPIEARRPPWDGGFSWEQDSNGKHFIATSNQGVGSSIWWPNKDHPYDEPDKGADLFFTAPSNLVAVGNGRLVGTHDKGETKSWHWRVVNPINNYGININIADYVHFSEKYAGEEGALDMDYWVLRENEVKAKKHFAQAAMTMRAFEHWFGPYPFYEDGYKLVEVPYLGMEHQSSVTYGNRYENGYLGKDLSKTGWGLKFDFIIVHESGHEWFANNITNVDVADMWIHEGFTAYSENLYLNYHFGKLASSEYVIGTRVYITNERPIIGEYGVRNNGGSDMYYKGANILHTLRQLLEDDEKWRKVFRGLNTEFRHQTVSSRQVEAYISRETGIDLTEFWQQYLRTAMLPKIEYALSDNTVNFKYVNIIDKFDMPVIAEINGEEKWLYPKSDWKTYTHDTAIDSFKIKADFYVESEEVGNR